jgi:hypothetical protein
MIGDTVHFGGFSHALSLRVPRGCEADGLNFSGFGIGLEEPLGTNGIPVDIWGAIG